MKSWYRQSSRKQTGLSAPITTSHLVALDHLTYGGGGSHGGGSLWTHYKTGIAPIGDQDVFLKDCQISGSLSGQSGSPLNVHGTLMAHNNCKILETLSVSGLTTLGGILGVTGATTLGGILGVTGPTTLGGTLGVTGPTTLGGTLGVTGPTTLGGTLGVTGPTTLGGTLAANQGCSITGDLAVSGTSTMGGMVTAHGEVFVSEGSLVVGFNNQPLGLRISGEQDTSLEDVGTLICNTNSPDGDHPRTVTIGKRSSPSIMLTAVASQPAATDEATIEITATDATTGTPALRLKQGDPLVSEAQISLTPMNSSGTGGRLTIGVDVTAGGTGSVQVLGAGLKVDGVLEVGGTVKPFIIPHPLDDLRDSTELLHVCIEAPTVDNLYRGSCQLKNGKGIANLDSNDRYQMTQGTFQALNKDTQVHVTNNETFDQVKAEIIGNELHIICENPDSDAKIDWLVIGTRQDSSVRDCSKTNDNGDLITERPKN